MFIVNETIPLVLGLNPNPNSISIDRNKIYSQTQTAGGFVFEHWGERPFTLKVRGKTQPILGSRGPGKNQEGAVEMALYALQQLYSLDKRNVLDFMSLLQNLTTKQRIKNGTTEVSDLLKLSTTFIYYKYDLYNGFFTKFSYEQNAESMPRHYEYEFEFLVTSTAQSALTESLFISNLSPVGPLLNLLTMGANGDMGFGAAVMGAGIVKGVIGI